MKTTITEKKHRRLGTGLMAVCALGGALLLGGCSKEVVDEGTESAEPTSLLEIATRAGGDADDPTPAVQAGFIYIFNSAGQCTSRLDIDEAATATTLISAGTFDIYAVGMDDASRYVLPAQAEATPQSEIGLAEGKVMDDLLMKHARVTLVDGETRLLNLQLERKVLRIDQVTIKQVPANVTKVEVDVEPLFKKVLLDGSYPAETEAVTIELTEGADHTWQAQPQRYHYPTDGTPTFTIRFTSDTGVRSYSYTSTEELPANHKVKIEGTYTAAQGVNLTGTLIGTDWGEDKNISFDFDEDNSSETTTPSTPSDGPQAGEFYKDCYVVSVAGNQATLLSPTEKNRIFTTSSVPSNLAEIIAGVLETWETPAGISGSWRLPTEAEARAFLLDANSFSLSNSNYTYYYQGASEVKAMEVQVKASGRTITGTNEELLPRNILRPVIDVTVE